MRSKENEPRSWINWVTLILGIITAVLVVSVFVMLIVALVQLDKTRSEHASAFSTFSASVLAKLSLGSSGSVSAPVAPVANSGVERKLDELRELSQFQSSQLSAIHLGLSAQGKPAPPPPPPPSDSTTTCDACAIPPSTANLGQLIDAEAVVLGAGAAGLYQAWTLVHELKVDPKKIVLIDASSTPGGRIIDECVNGDRTKCFGKCALRVNQAQVLIRDWARKLGVKLEWNIKPWKFIQGRGSMVQGTRPSLGDHYQGVTNPAECTGPAFDTTWGQDVLYWFLRPYGLQNLVLDGDSGQSCSAPLSLPLSKPQDNFDLRTYGQEYEGNEPFLFKRDWLNFRSLTADSNSNGTLEWLKEELLTYSDGDFYPVGGWSEIFNRAYANISAMGVRTVLMGDPVTCIWRDSGNGIVLRTKNNAVVRTKRVFNSIPPSQFNSIGGSLAEQVQADPHYKSIKTITVVTIGVWWKTRFWETLQPVSTGPTDDAATKALRKLYFITEAEGECFSRMEIYSGPYLRNQNVTRAVYDDGVCVALWTRLIKANNTAAIMQIIKQGIRRFLDQAGYENVVVPDEYHVSASVRDPAWHLLHSDSPYTNCEQEAWAVNPVPGQGFHQIGEAYAPQHMGWNNHVAKLVLRSSRQAYPTFNYNHLLGAKVCQSNEYITALANPNDMNSAHIAVPYPTAVSDPAYAYLAPMIASDGPACTSSFETATHKISCQNLVDTDTCHDLFIGNDPNRNVNGGKNTFEVFPTYDVGRTDASCTAIPKSQAASIASATSTKNREAMQKLLRRI